MKSKVKTFRSSNRNVFALFLLAGIFSVCAAKGQVIEWDRTYGGSLIDDASQIEATQDGGYIFVGRASSRTGASSGDVINPHRNGESRLYAASDVWVVKLDALGNIEWQKCLGGTSWEYGIDIKQAADGGYFVLANGTSADGDLEKIPFCDNDSTRNPWTSVAGQGGFIWVIRLDAHGNIVWNKGFAEAIYWNEQDRAAYSIDATSDGGCIIAGDQYISSSHTSYNYLIVKINATGQVEWDRSYGGSESDRAVSIQQTSDGGYIVSGGTSSADGDVVGLHPSTSAYPTSDSWIVKLDALGQIVWQKCLGGSGNDGTHTIRQTKDDGYILIGATTSFDGDVAGRTDQSGDPALDMMMLNLWVVRLDATGNIIWQKAEFPEYSKVNTIGDIGLDVVQTIDGGFAFIAPLSNPDLKTGHNLVVKLDANGSIVWQKPLEVESKIMTSIQVTKDTGFIVSGIWYKKSVMEDNGWDKSRSDYEAWVVKLKDTTVRSTGIAAAVASPLFHVFPNPTNGSLRVQLKDAYPDLTIQVVDVTGRVVTRVEGANKRVIDLKLEGAPGIYFLQVTSGAMPPQVAKVVLE